MAFTTCVAIFNASEDTIALLKEVLQQQHLRVVHGFIREFRSGSADMGAFILDERPDVVIWDISLPYHMNWIYFQQVQQSGALSACGVVLTTTNKARLEEIIGCSVDAIELVGKPSDLEVIVGAVRAALHRKHV
jgi:DNA-binding response OmpR family regulator